MRCYSTLTTSGCREVRFAARLLALYLCLLASAGADAQVATVLNPQPTDKISRLNTVKIVSSAATATPKNIYLLNGTCHNADKVFVTIRDNTTAVVVNNQAATVKGNVWEYVWDFTNTVTFAPGLYSIEVTPAKNNALGTPVPAFNVEIEAVVPALGGEIVLLPGSVIPGVYVRGVSGDSLLVSTLTRLFTSVATGYTATITLSGPASLNKVSTVIVKDAGSVKGLNNDDPTATVATNNSLPSSFTLGNTGTGVTSGLNTVTALITDGVSPAKTYKRSIIVDYSVPVVVSSLNAAGGVTFPAEDLVRIAGAVRDNNNNGANAPGGIASVDVVITRPNGTTVDRLPARLTYGANPQDNVTWTVDYNTGSLPSGNYRLYALITDNAGLVTFDAPGVPDPINTVGYPFAINQVTVPTVATFAPLATTPYFLSNGQMVRANVTTTNTATSGQQFTYELHGVSGMVDTLIASAVNAAFATNIDIPWDTTTAPNGLQVIRLKVTDSQKNTTTSSDVSVIVDNGKPVVSFAPVPNTFVGAAGIPLTLILKDNIVNVNNAITIVAQDDKGTAISFTTTAHNNPNGIPVTANYVPNNTPAGFSDGPRTITVTVTDKAGNISIPVTLALTVDTAKPTLSPFELPTPGQYLPGGKILVKGTISDTNTAATNVITWDLYDGTVAPLNLISTGRVSPNASAPFFPVKFAGTWDTASPETEDGHTLTVVATDAAGNVSDPIMVSVTVDRTDPAPTLKTPPNADAFVHNNITLEADYTDALVSLQSLRILVDGDANSTFIETETNPADKTRVWNTQMVANGPHMLTVELTDKAGNKKVTTPLRVNVDNASPEARILSPSANSTVLPGTTVVRGIVIDAHPPTQAKLLVRDKNDNTKQVELNVAVVDREIKNFADSTLSVVLPTHFDPPTNSIPILDGTRLELILKATDLTLNPEAASPTIEVTVGAGVPVDIVQVFVDGVADALLPKDDNHYHVRGTVQIKGGINIANLTGDWKLFFFQRPDLAMTVAERIKADALTTNPARGFEIGKGNDTFANDILTKGTPRTDTNKKWDTTADYPASESPKTYITLRADDTDINTPTDYDEIQVVVDNKPPAITSFPPLNSGGDNDFVSGTVTIRATINETYPESFKIYLDNPSGTPLDITKNRLTGANGIYQAEYSWDTSTVSQGAHKLYIEVIDKAQNSSGKFLKPVDVTVIRNAPNIAFTKLVTGSLTSRRRIDAVDGQFAGAVVGGGVSPSADINQVNENVVVSFQVSNPTYLKSWTLTAGSVAITGDSPTGRTASWNTKLNVAQGAEPAAVKLTLTATDFAGNTTTETATVTVDNKKPIVSITRPDDNATVTQNDSIFGSVSEANLVPASVVYTLTQNTTTITHNITASPYNRKVHETNRPDLPNGMEPVLAENDPITVKLTVIDIVGNKSETSKTIFIGASDPVKIGALEFLDTPRGIVTPDSSGIHYVRDRIKIKGLVNIDNLDPDPAKGWQLTVTDGVTTKPIASATSRVEMERYLTSDPDHWNTAASTFSAFNNMNPNGAHPELKLQLRAFTKAGQVFPPLGTEDKVDKKVIIDNIDPIPTFQILKSGTDNNFVKATVTIQVTIVEAHPQSFKLYVGDNLLDPVGNRLTKQQGNTYLAEYDWKTNDFADGMHTLTIEVTDKAGNKNVRSASAYAVTVVNNKPNIAFTRLEYGPLAPQRRIDALNGQFPGAVVGGGITPASANQVNQNVVVHFQVSNPVYLKSWTLTAGDKNITGNSPTGRTASWNTKSNVGEGQEQASVELKLTVTDLAGNETIATTNVIVDNKKPIVNITRPLPFATVRRDDTIFGSVTEANLADQEEKSTHASVVYTLIQGATTITQSIPRPPYNRKVHETNRPDSIIEPDLAENVPIIVKLTVTDDVGNRSEFPVPVNPPTYIIFIGAENPLRIGNLEFLDMPIGIVNPEADGTHYVRDRIAIKGLVDAANLDPAKGWRLTITDGTLKADNTLNEELIASGTTRVQTESYLTNMQGPWNTALSAFNNTPPNKTLSLQLRATTKANEVFPTSGTEGNVDKKVVIDNIEPSVVFEELKSATDNGYVRGTVTIQATITEQNLSRDPRRSFKIKIGNTMLTDTGNRLAEKTQSAGVWTAEYDWKTNDFADGVYTLTIEVTDLAGNKKVVTAPFTAKVSNRQPELAFTSLITGPSARRRTILPPSFPGAVVGGGPGNPDVPDEVAISFEIKTSVPNTLKSWTLFAKGSTAIDGRFNLGDSPTLYQYTALWNTAPADGNTPRYEGPIPLRLVLTDKSGHTTETTIVVTVDNRKPKPLLSALWAGAVRTTLDNGDPAFFYDDQAFVNRTVIVNGNIEEDNLPRAQSEEERLWRLIIIPMTKNGTTVAYPPSRTMGRIWDTDALEERASGHTPGIVPREYRIALGVYDAVGNKVVPNLNNPIGDKMTATQDVWVGDPAARLRVIGPPLAPNGAPEVPGRLLMKANEQVWHDDLLDDRNQTLYVNDKPGNLVRGELRNWSRYQLFGTLDTILDGATPANTSRETAASMGILDRLGRVNIKKSHSALGWKLKEGRSRLRLQAVNDNLNASDDPRNAANQSATNLFNTAFASLDIVLDATKPNVRIQAPALPTPQNGNFILPVAPGSVLTIIFDIENPSNANAADKAPLKRLPISVGQPGAGTLLDIPNATLTIPEVNPPGNETTFKGDLWKAIFQPSLTEANGRATVTARSDGGARITWQIPIVPSLYAYGQIYTIQISDVADLVNAADSKTTKFRVSTN